MSVDLLVTVTGLIRTVLVAAVFLLNVRALLQVCFGVRTCFHQIVLGAVLLANVLYLSSWFPYVIYSLLNGHWFLRGGETVFCLLQNFTVNAAGMVFLCLLAARQYEQTRRVLHYPPFSTLKSVLLLLGAWTLPQLIYDFISLLSTHTTCSTPIFHFLDDVQRFELGSSDGNDTEFMEETGVEGTSQYRVGLMLCQQELTPVSIKQHVWQYCILVLPLALLALLCQIVMFKNRHRILSYTQHCDEDQNIKTISKSTNDQSAQAKCDTDFEHSECQRQLVVVDLVLNTNLLWHLFVRPLMLWHSYYSWHRILADNELTATDEHPVPSAVFLDFGSHLVFTLSAVFVPFISKAEGKEVVTIVVPTGGANTMDGAPLDFGMNVKDKAPLKDNDFCVV